MNKRITYLRKFIALALVTCVWVCSGNLFAQKQSSTVRSPLAVVTNFPFIESFETNSPTLVDWTQMAGVGYGVDFWSFATGAGGGTITTAWEGTRNARFVSNSNYGNSAYLISPVLDLSGITSPKLSFYLGQEVWQTEQNTTKVFYRTSATAAWVQLAHYTYDIDVWTLIELDLPNPSATYQIAFEGINNYGRANVIDVVKVYENATPATVTSFPFTETFETSSATLSDWRQINETGTAIWTYAEGAGGGSITNAYEGIRNARFISNNNRGHKTKLVSPPLNLSTLTAPYLSFFLGQEAWGVDQNTTKVFYRTSATAPWVELAENSSNIPGWAFLIHDLPNPSATYQIAIECTNYYGRANVIDLVKVFEATAGSVVTSFPFIETFEITSTTLAGWRQQHITGGANWTFEAGAGGGNITTAFEGTSNARFIDNDKLGFETSLYTAKLDLSGMSSPKLSFYLGQEVWGDDQNSTKVLYRTSTTAPWVELAHYTDDIDAWTLFELDLPDPSATYQIAFQGTNNYGHANVIDLVKVYDDEAPPATVTVFPFIETFETTSTTLVDWRQIYEVNSDAWIFAEGAGDGIITTAYEGSRNARFKTMGNIGSITKLVTPPLDLSGISSPKLSFYLGQEVWEEDQNTTKVFYRTSTTAPWVELANYTDDIDAWTLFELDLPNKSATYQLAFEGTYNWGHSNVIDLVKVHEDEAPPATVTVFPFIETFETTSTTRVDWRQIYEVNSYDWTFVAGASGGNITTAFEGMLNARFEADIAGSVTKLVTPPLDLSAISSPKLSFYLGQERVSTLQSTTKVLYRISATAPWVQLADYTNSIDAWTQFVIDLPNKSATYQVAFEGTDNWGRTNVIDLVKVYNDEGTPATVTVFPFIETFETTSTTLVDWRQVYEVGSYNWIFVAGAESGNITSAFEGVRNARFDGNGSGEITKLVTPPLNLSSVSNPKLSFYLGQEAWSGDQSTTKVFYRTSATASWIELANYTNNINVWTQFELDLPNKSATYQLAFEATDNYGRSNVIDLVKVYENSMPLPVAVTNVAPLNGTINVNNGMALSWIFGSNTSQYELLLSTSNPPSTVVVPYTSTLATSYTLSGLQPNATYYWQVNVKNVTGTTPGPVWSFTTAAEPTPNPVNNIAPMNGAINIENGMLLNWAFGANTSEYQLLMGTTYPPSNVYVPYTSILSTSYTLFGLEYNKTYYWQVNARNAVGTTPGPIWSFTTVLNTGINDPGAAAAIKVYASGDVLYLESASKEATLVNVYNLTGQLVMQGKTNGDTHSTLNASTLSNGIYVVNVVQNNGVVFSRKVSIQR